MGKTNYALTVKLDERDVAVLTKEQPDISAMAAELLTAAARGGVLIPPAYTARVVNAIGAADPVAITEAVEKSVNRVGEAISVPWIVDPTQIDFYRYQAENAGISLEQQLKAHLDYAYSQGWLGSSAPDAVKILLTPEQYRQLQQMFSSDIVTGKDVMEALLDRRPAPAEEDDVIMQSLRGK